MTANRLVSTTDKKWAIASKEISIPWSRKVNVGGFSYQRFLFLPPCEQSGFFFFLLHLLFPGVSWAWSRVVQGPYLTLSLQSSWLLDGSPNQKVLPTNMHSPLVWLLTPLHLQDVASLCLLHECLSSHGALRVLQTMLYVGEEKISMKSTFWMFKAFR